MATLRIAIIFLFKILYLKNTEIDLPPCERGINQSRPLRQIVLQKIQALGLSSTPFPIMNKTHRPIFLHDSIFSIWSLILFLCCHNLSAGGSHVWIEDPAATNFPTIATWSVLRGGKAPAVLTETPEQNLFVQYEFEIPSPGGEYEMWGRTYDPSWSSPARWRFDDASWQDWKPGPTVNREVANGTFAIEWHSWGKIALPPGKHQLRVELTGKRPRGDIRFYALDALLLSKGNFAPRGVKSPVELVADQQAIIEAKLHRFTGDQKEYLAESNAIAMSVLESDLGAFRDFGTLNERLDRALEAQKSVERNLSERLSGLVSKATVQDGILYIETDWSQKFEGKVWIGVLQNEALYTASILSADLASKQAFSIPLPEGLPSGSLSVICVPVGQKLAKPAQKDFPSPTEPGNSLIKPSSWGIYRDSNLRAHPWNVTSGGMMMWDGQPHIPVGGMMNTKLSWTTKPGDKSVHSVDILKAQLELLKRHGIDDVYFNAFFLNANPAALAAIIATAEETGMHYGLHVASFPTTALRSAGFVRWNRAQPFGVGAGANQATIKYPASENELVPSGRCIWAVFSSAGKVLASGIGIPTISDAPADASKGRQNGKKELTLVAKFSSPLPESGTMIFVPELRMSPDDPSGYLDGIATYIRQLQEVYGGLHLGPGLRMWIDPFINEIHCKNNEVSTSETFQSRYSASLSKRYQTIENLNRIWAPSGDRIPTFEAAARLVPLWERKDSIFWMDPKTQKIFSFSSQPGESLHDLARIKGALAEEMISEVADTLKDIADVPVILKHNTWFSDWFVNPRKSGGQDGIGYESYCYGDSLAYHNSLVPLAEALASARHQWRIETETSAAAFDGQKSYVGYLDRLQMLHDFDLMAKFGAKGIFAFGFAFDPPLNFQITELLRDPRQLEWMATYAKSIRAAAKQLSTYNPEVYGWYPASLRERQFVSGNLKNYEMDGHYLGTKGQIRMAPNGSWIIPAFIPTMNLKGLLVGWDFLTEKEKQALITNPPQEPVWLLGNRPKVVVPKTWQSFPLDSFTASGIGVIPATPQSMTLDEFRKKILGYQVFQTVDLNGQTLPDGSLMVWTCVEREEAIIRLPSSAQAVDLQGNAIAAQNAGSNLVQISLKRTPGEKLKGNLPLYLAHLPSGYYYKELPQTETIILKGITVADILRLNPPAWHRWLPAEVPFAIVAAWKEGEDFTATTFVQPRVEGYSRYSGGAAIGINTHWLPPEGKKFSARYDVEASHPFASLWVRRMDRPAMELDILIDGKSVGRIPAKTEYKDLLHLNPWNAGLGMADLKVGWAHVPLPQTYSKGRHTIELVALPSEDKSRKLDAALLGGQSDESLEKQASEEISKLQGLQIDALMLSK